MNLKLVGELIGIVAIFESFFIYLSNRRKHIIFLKGVSDAIWAVNSFLIGAFTGGVLNLIMIFREFVFYNRIDKKWARHRFWMFFFIAMCFASPTIEIIKTGTFALLPFFPACGSVVAVFGFYAENPKWIRILNFLAAIPWLIYTAMTNNITSTVSGIVGMCSMIFGTVISKKIKQK